MIAFRIPLLAAACLLAPITIAMAQTAAPSPEVAPIAEMYPNLAGHVARPLRYHPDRGDFVIENGAEFFNRSLYGGNTAFRVDGGDKPEFLLYLPGRGGNLRLGIRSGGAMKWLQDAATVVTRYRPGELIYEVQDPVLGAGGKLTLEVLAYADAEGLIVRAQATGVSAGTELLWAFGGVNGKRGARDGDIGTEKVPISQYFQFQPELAAGNTFELGSQGFVLKSKPATIVGVLPAGARQHVADADKWNDLPGLFAAPGGAPKRPIAVGSARLTNSGPLLLSLQRLAEGAAAFDRAALPREFAAADAQFHALRNRVRMTTPDPYLDAAMGSLNVVADALWDENAHAIMHGSIAWRTKLLGWRGPYALDDLGWHDRARENLNTWLPHQNVDPIAATLPPADESANMARNEPGLHTNGDLSHSHYDMNMVFMDVLFRHLLWTGDKAFARTAWPAVERHIAWERRLFRREYGPAKLPLYEAYAGIWASDDLYYDGGGTAYASAYNVYANRMAARIAASVGEDPVPYTEEADRIEQAMRTLLWLPDRGAYAEYKDILGRQPVHPDYGLWTFYHTVDEQAATPREAWQMGEDLKSHLRAIPVAGPGVPNDAPYHVYSESDWMPYSWSINNVVMDENMHTALALWEGGQAEEAFAVAKGSLLASMYMGISPGNVGTMDYLDAYRRESQRDFGDSAGAMSRAIVEGLFGMRPDALSGTLTVAPGFPPSWAHARITHPDFGLDFVREGRADTWRITQNGSRFKTLHLRLSAVYSQIASVEVDGKSAEWRSAPDSTGAPALELTVPAGAATTVRIAWTGEPLTRTALAQATPGLVQAGFTRMSLGAFEWWQPVARTATTETRTAFDWRKPLDAAKLEGVDLTHWFNDSVTAIFAPGKYRSPRSAGVSLALPSQGIGAWAGHLKLLPVIDDTGLRRAAAEHAGKLVMPDGIAFATPGAADAKNILFTSQWDNYPHEIAVPLSGRASHAFLLMAGSTNFMQSHLENGEVIVAYTDGTSARLALRNPETWWPIEQDYFIDDYQFPLDGPLPPRVDLKTGRIRLLDAASFQGKGGDVAGGAATVLEMPLDPGKELRSLTVRTLANDVVIGLMSVTLERP